MDVKNTIIPVVADGAVVLGQRFLDAHYYNIASMATPTYGSPDRKGGGL